MTTDGPYVEGKEHIGGFTIITAPDLDKALEWARIRPGDDAADRSAAVQDDVSMTLSTVDVEQVSSGGSTAGQSPC